MSGRGRDGDPPWERAPKAAAFQRDPVAALDLLLEKSRVALLPSRHLEPHFHLAGEVP